MPAVKVAPAGWGVLGNLHQFSTAATVTVNVTNGAWWVHFIAPKAGDIDRVCIEVQTIVGTSPDWEIALQAVSGGLPDGTDLATVESWTPSTTGNKLVTLTNPVSLTRGKAYVLIIRHDGVSTIDGSNNVGLRFRSSANQAGEAATLTATYNGTSATWTANQSPGVLAVYDDGDGAYQCTGGIDASDSSGYDYADNPNQKGNRFKCPTTCTTNGLWTVLRNYELANSDNFVFELSSDDLSTVLASATVPFGDLAAALSSIGSAWLYWDSDFEMIQGTWYRLSLRPESSNTTKRLAASRIDFVTALKRQSVQPDCYAFTRQHPSGSATDDETMLYHLYPLVREFSAVNGMLVHTGMNGGMGA